MKHLSLLILCVVFSVQTFGQKFNETVMDEKSGTPILIGNCTLSGLYEGEFGQMYQREFSAYKAGNDALNQLKYKLDEINFTVVLGTWCGDSKEQVGRFMKVLAALKYDTERCTLIAVDRAKLAGDVDVSGLNITLVPTFIVFRNGKEIGRITETPVKTIEDDLVSIILK